MSNKIIKQKPVIQEKEVHWKAKCLYMLAGIAVAYGLAFLMLGKNDGVIFMQWHIYDADAWDFNADVKNAV